jgi:hypothetical protein
MSLAVTFPLKSFYHGKVAALIGILKIGKMGARP